MISFAHADATVRDEHAAAVARLEADLLIASSGAGGLEPDVLAQRRAVTAAYRSALAGAAGCPADPSWDRLANAIAAFLARLPGRMRSGDATAAKMRLELLRLELLAEPLDLRRDVPAELRILEVK